MSKLLGILTQDADSIKAEDAALEVAQQNVNLQSFEVATQRNLSQLRGQQNAILRRGGPGMWASYDQITGQIDELTNALDRIQGYKAEFFG